MPVSIADLLVRLQPVLAEIFAAYEISEDQARQIVEQSCTLLLVKRWGSLQPRKWLVRTVIERCQAVALERFGELEDEEPS